MNRQDNLKDLRKLSVADLATKISETELEISNLKFQAVSQQLENPIKLRELRRNIARMKTLITQMQNQAGEEVAND